MHVDRSIGRGTLAAFFAWLVVLSSLFWVVAWLAASGTYTFGGAKSREWFVTGLMWCPGLAALIACATTRTPFAVLGFQLPRLRWLGIAYLYPLAYLVIAYALIWAFGIGGFDATAFAEDAAKRWSLTGTSAIVTGVLALLTIGVLVEVGRSLGEEIGWRGLLSPAFVERWGLLAGGIGSGLVWGLWHLPLLTAFGFGELPTWYAVPMFLCVVAPVGFVCAWLRWASGSVWPAVIVHCVHNALLYPMFDMNTVPAGASTAWATGETGWALAVVNVVFAFFVWRSVHRRGNIAMASRTAPAGES
jgi:membrane protease YdiL (CAAX protease family)